MVRFFSLTSKNPCALPGVAVACCIVACSSNDAPPAMGSNGSTTADATTSASSEAVASTTTSGSSATTSPATSTTTSDTTGGGGPMGMSSAGGSSAVASTDSGGASAVTATAMGGAASESATTGGGSGAAAGSGTGGEPNSDWVDLFNGVDLTGWVAHDGGRGDANSLPIEDVFQVVDGEIHVYRGASNGSTQVFGNLRNETVLSGNYVLHVEYRWGTNKFAPRANVDRDAGILFHITGNDVTKVFPDSLEMQIGDSDVGGDYMTGDLWVLGVPTVAEVMIDGELTKVGDVGGDSVPHYASVHAENPHGEWNVCEITVNGSESAVYRLNEVEVHRLYNFTYEGQPLDRGFVSVQAEWAEVFYRNIRYRQL